MRGDGEVIGEADVREGEWFYASGRSMKQSPFSQARQNRYALTDKLIQRLGKSAFDLLTITHAVWFPDVHWSGPMSSSEAARRTFLLDPDALAKPAM